jgi:SNF2 domain-containing protein/helicase-like protein
VKYRFRTKPYKHQLAGIKFVFSQFSKGLGAALFFEPRTGKTKTTVDIASILHLKKGVRKVLVIAPNRVLGTWVQEIATHSPLVCQTYVWDSKTRKKGPPPQPPAAYDLQFVIVNFEAFGTPGRRTKSGRRSRASGRFKNRTMLTKWLAGEDAMIVVDESHKLKNPSGMASNMIVGMRSMFTHHMILTGTPITKAKRAADIYMQFHLINPSRFAAWGSTYDDFKNHTGRWISTNGFPQWVKERPAGMRDLRNGLHKDGMVVRRDDCFDLPEKLPDRIIPVPLTTSGRHYDEMAQEMVTQLENGEIAEASIPLIVTLRLAQITSGHVGILEPHPTNPNKQISKPVTIGREKLRALKELLEEETIEREEKVVIVARWRPDLNDIRLLCKKLGIRSWSIQGGLTRHETDNALREFKRHEGAGAMIVQPQAGGVGVDMSTASEMIWYSLTPSYVDFKQMNDRIALAKRGVRYTYLLAPGTVDDLMMSALINDGDVTRMILTKPTAILRR